MNDAIMPALADLNANYIGTDELDKTFESGSIDWPGLFMSLDELNRSNGFEKSLPRSRNSSGRRSSLKRRTSETLSEPVDEDKEIHHSSWDWEYRSFALVRTLGYGFGIAISGGRDNPHFTTGEPSIVVSDVLRVGPAWGQLQVNDRIIEANGVNLENVDYSKAVETMKDTDNLNMVIKRRIPVPTIEVEQRTLKFTLSKSKTKEDFGIVLGCKFYIKGITNPKLATKEPGLREGDAVVSINGQPADDMSFKDAQKLLDRAKEKLSLVIQRDVPRGTCWKWPSQSTIYERVGPSRQSPAPSPLLGARSRCSSEGGEERSSGPTTTGVARLRGRISQRQSADLWAESSNRSSFVSVGSRPRTPGNGQFELPPSGSRPNSTLIQSTSAPQTPRINRPITPNNCQPSADGNSTLTPTAEMYAGRGSPQVSRKPPAHPQLLSDLRCITFVKSGGSVGMRVIGGNEVGIFVSAVQLGSRAAERGVKPGDKILKVNGRDMKGMTREEAVLLLLGLQEQIELLVQHRQEEFERVRSQGFGDSFYIRTHFDFDAKSGEEISFKRGDILQVTDTLHGGLVGNWQAVKIYSATNIKDVTPTDRSETQGDGLSPSKGIIPSASKAEKLAATQMLQSTYKFSGGSAMTASAKSSPGLFKFRRRATSAGGDNSSLTSLDDAQAQLLKKSVDGHYDEVVLGKRELIHDAAYERVQLRHPGFFRPVVLYGALADIAREKLLNEMPLRFATVRSDSVGRKNEDPTAIRLSEIRDVVARNKHCLLDVTPSSVERLNYSQQCPIVIFLNVETRSRLKELRKRHSKESAMKNSRKLMELAIKIQKSHSGLFTAVLDASREENWFDGLSNLIAHLQERRVWVSECPLSSLDDDFLFPLNAKNNYESEMDMENYQEFQNVFESPVQRQQLNGGNPHNNNNIMTNSMYENHLNSDPQVDNITNVRVNSSASSSLVGPNAVNRGQMQLSFGQRDYPKRNLPSRLNIMPESDLSISMNSAATADTNRSDASLTPTSPVHHARPFGQTVFEKGTSKNPLPDVLKAHNKHELAHGSVSVGSVKLPMGTSMARPEGNYQSPADRRRSPASAYRYHSEPGVYDIRQILQADSDEYSTFVGSSNLSQQSDNSRTTTPSNRPIPFWQSKLNRPGPFEQPTAADFLQPRNSPQWNRIERRSSNENRASPMAFRPAVRVPPSPDDNKPPMAADNNSFQPQLSRSVYQSAPIRPQHSVPPTRHNYLTQNDILRGSQPTHTVVTNPQSLPPTTLTVSPLISPVESTLNNSADSGFRSKSPGTSMTNSRLYQTDSTGLSNDHRLAVESYSDPITPSDPVTIQPTQSRLARRFFSSGNQKLSRTELPETSASDLIVKSPPVHNNSFREITTTAIIETQRQSNNQSESPTTKVLGEVKGIVGPDGATFLSESTGVSIRIPPGALMRNEEIFFKVCGDDSIVLPLNKDEGEKLLSPLVMCGPKGLTFMKPVEIRLPHNEVSVNSEEWSFALKTGNSDESGNAEWENVSLAEIKAAKRGKLEDGYISLLIDHF